MGYQFSISDMGLRLIKAYEGFHAAPRDLISGERVLGYGHRVIEDDRGDISEDDAETLLKNDLEHIEEFLNTHVHTALSQSQFDALCSLVYSIGAEAFLTSDVYHALNQGQVIEAANGFDAWRLSEIAGETYVVDALVRRRTAEKALFLRPIKRLTKAPRLQVPAQSDPDVHPDGYSSWSRDRDPARIVEAAPIFKDSVGGTDNDQFEGRVGAEPLELVDRPSPIAEAAAEVSDRLESLMEDGAVRKATENWPDTLVETRSDDNVLEFRHASELVEGVDYNVPQDEVEAQEQNLGAYMVMTLVGFLTAIAGVWLSLSESSFKLGSMGPLITFAAIFIGALLFMAGAYYLVKTWIRN